MWSPRFAAALTLSALALLILPAASAHAAGRADTVVRFAGTAGLAQLAADPGGGVVAADPRGDRVVRIAPDGGVTVVAGASPAGLDTPVGVALAADGTVYVSDARHRVAGITADGHTRIVAGTGTAGAPAPGPAAASPLQAPAGLAVDRAGNLFIADPGAGAVLRVSPTGTLSVAVPATRSRTVAVDSLGNLYVTADAPPAGADRAPAAEPGPPCSVERIAADGVRSPYAGSGCGRPAPGAARASRLGPIDQVSVDEHDNLVLATADGVAVVAADGALSVRGAGVGGRSAVTAATGAVFVGGDDDVARIGPPTPSAPRDLRVTPRDRSLELSFHAPLDPGAGAVTGYDVSLDGAQTWRPLPTEADGDRVRGSVPRLDNGVQYAVLVAARNADGRSPGSVILPAVPGAALLAVTGADVAVLAWTGLFAVLVGVTLLLGGTGWNADPCGVRSAP